MGSLLSTSHFNYDEQLLQWTGKKFSKKVIESTNPEQETGVYRNHQYPNIVEDIPSQHGDPINNLWEAFLNGLAIKGDGECYGYRPYKTDENKTYIRDKQNNPKRGSYKWFSFKQIHNFILEVAHGLKAIGANKGESIGIFCNNRPEWMITAFASWSQGYSVIPLYATLGENAVEYIINHIEMKYILVSKDKVSLMDSILNRCPSVKIVIQTDPNTWLNNTEETLTYLKHSNTVNLMGFSEIISLGSKVTEKTTKDYKKDEIAYIMYTSGTTGVPKGVVMTHGNLISIIKGLEAATEFKKEWRYMSYLPMAHSLESAAQVTMMYRGVGVGFFQGNIKLLQEDFLELRPSVLCGVPRVFSRIMDKVFAGVNSAFFLKRFVFNYMYNKQVYHLRNGLPLDKSIDANIFSKVREKVGWDKIKVALTGAAPCPPNLLEFMRIVVGPDAVAFQGFGLTEGCAGSCITDPTDYTSGNVGCPLPCNEFKLVSVPELNYTVTGNKFPMGELQLRGSNICSTHGYYKDEESTKNTFKDGWLCTGDIVRLNPSGTLTVIDRKKNIFKLSQGEYIAVEALESKYSQLQSIWQIWIYGDSMKSFVVAVIVPNAAIVKNIAVERWGWECNYEPGTKEFIKPYMTMFEQNYAEIKKWIRDQLKIVESNLQGFEKINDFFLEHRIDTTLMGFTEDNDCITPTLKLKRPNLLKRYSKEIDNLYR